MSTNSNSPENMIDAYKEITTVQGIDTALEGARLAYEQLQKIAAEVEHNLSTPEGFAYMVTPSSDAPLEIGDYFEPNPAHGVNVGLVGFNNESTVQDDPFFGDVLSVHANGLIVGYLAAEQGCHVPEPWLTHLNLVPHEFNQVAPQE